jgi:hypothetical protein
MILLGRSIRLAVIAAIAVSLPSACDTDKTYPVTFVCASNTGASCPLGEACPELPLSSDSCGDLPGLFGHPATPETTGRPVGCRVGLSYGNPYYSDTQVMCTCTALTTSAAPEWICPI